jgi:acyl-CoA reductase-like NAD-dependent aldehyde dehydrogenase
MAMQETFKSLSGHIYLDRALRKGTGANGCDSIDPATEEVNGELAFTSIVEVDEAVAVARKAQVKWDRMSGLDRSEQLHEVARRLRNLIPELAEAATREMGKPYKESANEAY